MRQVRHGVLATRALNEYRMRDINTYLSTRYFVDAVAARTDNWARIAAIDAILNRCEGSYLGVKHFKELDCNGGIHHRLLFMPTGEEAVAEAALLDQVARGTRQNQAGSVVFSNRLITGESRTGIFLDYMSGLRERQRSIAKACSGVSDAVVMYTDIRNFYPSINSELAVASWRALATETRLPNRFQHVGDKLLADYSKLGEGLPIGPVFAHVVANAVLRDIDSVFGASREVRYFRYVDDIVLVGDRDCVNRAYVDLNSRLSNFGLVLHSRDSSKTLEVPAKEWLAAAQDFQLPEESETWPALVWALKRLLLIGLETTQSLGDAFRANRFRMPLQDYSRISKERTLVERVLTWSRRPFSRKSRDLATRDGALALALKLRDRYYRLIEPLIESTRDSFGFERKRQIPRLRYLAGRMTYLADDDQLGSCARRLLEVPELRLHAVVMQSVATGNVGDVIALGSNAAQASAQALQAAEKFSVEYEDPVENADAVDGALAVLAFNGIRISEKSKVRAAQSDLLRFAREGTTVQLMKSENRFVRTTACLRGLDSPLSHHSVIGTAFDADERFTLDAIEQLQRSASF